MKQPILISLSALFLALSLAACTTVGIPKKTSPDDCLVLIRTTVTNETDFADARVYKFYYSEGIRPTEVDEGRNSFVAVRVQKPGAMLIKLHSEISQLRGNFYGDPTNQDMDLDLPYKAGQVVIADFAFVKRVAKNPKAEGFITYADFKRLSQEEKDVLMEMAAKLKIVEKWEKR